MTEKPEDLLDFDHYLQKTHFKTASLLANSARAVAILGGGKQEVFQLAYDYGQHLGLAFQLIDDVLVRASRYCSSCFSAFPFRTGGGVRRAPPENPRAPAATAPAPQDFTGSAKTLGKPALNDLRSGLATAPTLYAAEQFPALRPLIQRKFKEDGALVHPLCRGRLARIALRKVLKARPCCVFSCTRRGRGDCAQLCGVERGGGEDAGARGEPRGEGDRERAGVPALVVRAREESAEGAHRARAAEPRTQKVRGSRTLAAGAGRGRFV